MPFVVGWLQGNQKEDRNPSWGDSTLIGALDCCTVGLRETGKPKPSWGIPLTTASLEKGVVCQFGGLMVKRGGFPFNFALYRNQAPINPSKGYLKLLRP